MQPINHAGRRIRGYAIISKGDTPQKIQRGMWSIPSQSGNGRYIITRHADSFWTCECQDYQKRGITCKHIYAIQFWLGVKDKVENAKPIEKPKYNIEVCPHCMSEKLIKRGIRKNANVEKQRYSCKKCKRRFVIDIAKKTKGNGQIVTLCLDLYFKGISLRKIQDHLWQFYNMRISHMTIQRWIRKFMQLANQHAKAMMPKVSGLWHADEQMIRNNGGFLWVWNCMDSQTRFLLANNVTEGRDIDEARQVFSKAKECGTADIVVTDGLHSYNTAIKKELNAEHIKADGLTSPKKNNNLIERFHGSFRERDKVMRGFKGKDNAQFLADANQTYYNFVRPHQSLAGLTPAQMAGIRIGKEKNRWISLLK